MSDNEVEELLNAIDKHTNAIRAELRAVDQGDSAKTDQADKESLGTRDLEALTGTKAGTWRYWASIGQGPASFKLGRRRVWKMSVVREWLAEQENRADEVFRHTNGHNKIGGMNDGAAVMTRPAAQQAVSAGRGVRRIRLPRRRPASTQEALQVS